jgi:tetratricopeptide (TPR) repeat protein
VIHELFSLVYGCIFRVKFAGAVLLAGSTAILVSGIDQSAEQANASASRAIEAGHFVEAVSDLQSALRRFPDNHRLQFNLGLALVRLGRLSAVVDPLRTAAQDPTLAGEAHFLLGIDYFEDKHYPSAINELSGSISAGPRERVLYMREESYRRTGRVSEAKATFHDLFTHYPDSAWTHYLMGSAYEDQHEPDKALEEYKQAARKDPALPNIDFTLGYVYFRQGNIAEAQEWLGREVARGCHSLANYYLAEIARGTANYRNRKCSIIAPRVVTRQMWTHIFISACFWKVRSDICQRS